jgi:hypothetical protein
MGGGVVESELVRFTTSANIAASIWSFATDYSNLSL